MTDTYTDYYALCVDGILSYPYSVGPGVQCYNGEPVASSWTQPEQSLTCDFEGIRCLSTDGVFQTGFCLETYRRCVDGLLSAQQTVDQGYICNSGQIKACDNCQCFAPIHRCSFVGIQCVTEFGYVSTEFATDYYQECVNGESMMPMWVFAVLQLLVLMYLGVKLLKEAKVVDLCVRKNWNI